MPKAPAPIPAPTPAAAAAALPARLSGVAAQPASRFADKAKDAGKPTQSAPRTGASPLGVKQPSAKPAIAKRSSDDDDDGDVSPMDLSPEVTDSHVMQGTSCSVLEVVEQQQCSAGTTHN